MDTPSMALPLPLRQTVSLVRAFRSRRAIDAVLDRLEDDIADAVRGSEVIPACLDKLKPLPPLRKATVIPFPKRAS